MHRAPRRGAGARAALGVVALALVVVTSRAAGPVAHAVTIDGFEFHPPLLTVKQGEAIEWRNADPVPHTVTAKDAGLDSREIPANGTYRFTARRKGRFGYFCTLHPTMKGTLVVE